MLANPSLMFFNITLEAKSFNRVTKSNLYELNEKFEIQMMKTLIPRKIENLTVLGDIATPHSAYLSLTLPEELKNVSRDMMFDVRYKLTGDGTENWKKIEKPRLQEVGEKIILIIDNLDFANTVYNVKIRIKANEADDDDEMWSPWQDISIKTRSKLPEMVPKTCSNCYNIMDNNNIVIYWMEVPKSYQNADNFKYNVRVRNAAGSEYNETLEETSLVLSRTSNADNSLVDIFSVNDEGTSATFSQIIVSPIHEKVNVKLLKIRKQLINNEYKVSWKLLNKLDVESFTIIYCEQHYERPNQCDGSVKLVTLPPVARTFSISASSSRQFGVAVNLVDHSLTQGFEWAECTAAQQNGK